MLKRRLLSQKQQSKHNFSLGQSGEDEAVIFLEKEGYQVLDRNVRYGTKEIDVIALDKEINELVFIEVKTRKKDYFGDPSKAVDKRKLRSMQYVGAIYRRIKKLDLDYRFDTITIVSGRIRHYRNISW
ncbi:MAG: YraN family protein [Candidatus Pacebacteria bacterium]|nr:YraN family protein [Candidatus Paceibacterota bacterium]MBT3512077.1 YraN family protein [Candidatus Paceibacterota bacterium]MBT4005205.1 YraN family protein [Candidatus Paceibacterota bacterium]MBT4358637.1 YraN family protein [Candidatus Paceibacterota bacterium]MBT4680664.1 YraN family protein [Candidatus Paceibacterota bacterium]